MTSKTYTPTIGLEIHAELKTFTKMFCNSKNDPDAKEPNSNVCPVCMGHPGTLPVINKQAVKHVLRMGVAVGGKLADFTEFDRKNYFYPDIPKGYQISQYKYPLVSGGKLAGITLTRIHLEEDTAKSTHDKGEYSLVDFNRAGVPLMELVTEPEITSSDAASSFAKELQLLLQYLGAGDANMEKGEMRVEANISVSDTPGKFGTKVEVKNLNSFKAVEKAIAYEIERHSRLLERGEKVVQETRGWDEDKQVTFTQRLKEYAHDYRYFPDPDLPKLEISSMPEFQMANLKAEMPELPWEKRERYMKTYGMNPADAEQYVSTPALARYFEAVIADFKGDTKRVKLASNYISSDYVGLLKQMAEKGSKSPEGEAEVVFHVERVAAKDFSDLISMISEGKLSSRGAKDTLAIMVKEGGNPAVIAETKGLIQKNDEGELKRVMEEIIKANPAVVQDYKNGKAAALQFFVGQGMKATKGSANPELLKKLVLEVLA